LSPIKFSARCYIRATLLLNQTAGQDKALPFLAHIRRQRYYNRSP
jgi:hypothetical protein